jgi:hypothetical protein
MRVRVLRLCTGISIKITRPDRHRLEAIARDRNAPQKHVWRADIVLLSADGVGTILRLGRLRPRGPRGAQDELFLPPSLRTCGGSQRLWPAATR